MPNQVDWVWLGRLNWHNSQLFIDKVTQDVLKAVVPKHNKLILWNGIDFLQEYLDYVGKVTIYD